MTARPRSATTRRRRPYGIERDPLVVTKLLVAHRPAAPDDPDDLHWGPEDGEPVAIPAPCSRLAAGYWCSCGSGFASISGWQETTRARVAAASEGCWAGFVDGNGGYIEPGVRWPTDADRRALQDQVEALPIGAVVERHGTGIAPAFEDRPRQLVAPDAAGSDLPPF